MPRLENKIAIISGAANGIGRVTAECFVAEGATVIVADIDCDNGRQLEEALGPNCRFKEQNVSREADWKRVVGETVTEFGRLDVLVNNAGLLTVGNIETLSLELWQRTHAVCVEGTFLGCKYAVKQMKSNGGGAIINLASIATLQTTPSSLAYGAAKAGVESLSRSVAAYCHERGYHIRCNSVHPGPVDTGMVRNYSQQVEVARKETGFALPNRFSTVFSEPAPSLEIAEAILYLATEASRGVNGTRLVVDRGASSF